MDKRLFIKKTDKYDFKSKDLLKELITVLNVPSLKELKIYNIYDIYNIDINLLNKIKNTVFAKINIDQIETAIPEYKKFIAFEPLPLQFNNRAHSALQLISIYNDDNLKVDLKTGTFIGFNYDLEISDLNKIKHYLINPIEQQEKDLTIFKQENVISHFKILEIHDFNYYDDIQLKRIIEKNRYSLSLKQMKIIQEYFKKEKRNPKNSELMMFNIYWSDHCRHITLNTKINDVKFELKNNNFKNEVKKTYDDFLTLQKKLNKTSSFSLMDISLITKKLLEKKDKLNDIEKSDENNAISIKTMINNEPHYLIFKNETHNHPTEIEPFGGASTCLGGAMRDIFASRAYCFAGMRISGCGNILEKNNKTLPGKLPQYKIAKMATKGFSSYGNQVGLATQFIDEYYDKSYTAKHLECGAVLGVVPKKWINKSAPKNGDLIMILGGKTGIDGIGGASGSSKMHDNKSTINSYSEVQKGNPIIARKMQRLYFSKPEFIKLIKRSNDFGAGGASVAIGEIANGMEIYLEKFKTKDLNINPHEILFSESQERMAMVIDAQNKDKFIKYAHDENLDAYVVGKVTNTNYISCSYNKEQIINISKQFLTNSAYVETTDISVENDPQKIQQQIEFDYELEVKNLNNKIKKGLVETFDNSIGGNSILNNMGGEHLLTKSNCLISSIPSPITKKKDMNVIITTGFNIMLANKSAYHMGYYSVIESLAKLATQQLPWNNTKISLQEYFPTLSTIQKWALPFTSLLGVYKVLRYFNLPVVGGKDSMSGTYNNLDVIPTIITFAINTFNSKKIITNELKKVKSYIYLLHHKLDKNNLVNLKNFKKNIDWFRKQKDILAAETITDKSLEMTLIHMALGNKVSLNKINLNNKILSKVFIGDIIFQTNSPITNNRDVILIGEVILDNKNIINLYGTEYKISQIINDLKHDYENLYPYISYQGNNNDYTNTLIASNVSLEKHTPLNQEKCVILHPIFPGTNCEYDTLKKFKAANHKVVNNVFIFKNKDENEVKESIEKLAIQINEADIIMLNGGFSLADEPDGSAKYISCILNHPKIKSALEKHLSKKKLILGICNGFQALINSGLLPNGNFNFNEESPVLNNNPIEKHIATIVNTKYLDINSPWITKKSLNKIFKLPISHGEGSFMANAKTIEKLIKNCQIASAYCNIEGKVIGTDEINPNNSYYNIEGIISLDGLIFGKMGHSERIKENLYTNINSLEIDPIFENGVNYILGINAIKSIDKKSKIKNMQQQEEITDVNKK